MTVHLGSLPDIVMAVILLVSCTRCVLSLVESVLMVITAEIVLRDSRCVTACANT